MIIHQERRCPEPWRIYRQRFRRKWLGPILTADWVIDWMAYYLSRWVLIELLEYLGTFSILVAVIFYFAESGDRVKQRHYQAWQVINTAQGKGGSGGRIEALQELNADRVPLVGVDLRDAFLQGVHLDRAALSRSEFGSADLRSCSLKGADLTYAGLNTTNLRGSNLAGVRLANSDLKDADLSGAELEGADLSGARLDGTDLRKADLDGAKWAGISSMKLANIYGAKRMPHGFADWATRHGAVSIESDEAWNAAEAGREGH